MTEPEVILHVGAEGGSIKLYAAIADGAWRFRRYVVDQTPELIGEPWSKHTSEDANSWPEALVLLDEYQWYRFVPLSVHPEFRTLVYSAVVERCRASQRCRHLDEWRRLCEVPQSDMLPGGK